MKRRTFIKTAAASSLFSLLPRTGLFAETSASFKKPNVLFLFSDQHNATATGFGGHPNVQTPVFDRLAAQGACFNRAYCTNAVCAPSRNSILTGQYPRTFGMHDNSHADTLDLHASILPRLAPIQSVFHQAGYYTFTAGKRHIIPALDRNWDYSAGHLNPKQWPSEAHDTLNYWNWIAQQNLTDLLEQDMGAEKDRAGHSGTQRIFASAISVLPPEATMEAFTAAQTIQFLKSPQAKKKPFFAWSTFYRPHQPYTPPQKYADQIDYAALTLPASLHQDPNDLPPGLKQVRLQTKGGWACGAATEADYRRYMGYYIALVQEIDDHIGAILKTLEEQGLAENTIIVYTSDHGCFFGNHGLPEKHAETHNFYEDTLRVPMIIHWPGKIPGGQVRQDLVETIDLYPTILDLCGLASPPAAVRPAGRNLRDPLVNQTPVGRQYVVSENWSQATVITDDFKYGQWLNSVYYPSRDWRSWGNMLMQRSTDPGEVKNRIKDPTLADTQKLLQGYLNDWVSRVDDSGRREFFKVRNREYTVV